MAAFALKAAFVGALALATSVDAQAGYDTSGSAQLGPPNANCQRQNLSISVSSDNIKWKNVDSNSNVTIITKHILDFITSPTPSQNFSDLYEAGRQTVSATYRISGTLCTPKSNQNGVKNSTVQLLVHGIGFDSSYWNFNVEGNYPYTHHAAEAGYTTFRYDRLGTGLSEHPSDTFNIVQAATDLAILTKVVSELRAGSIGHHKFSTIIGVGHSYGSIQLNALSAKDPSAVDSLVLTGFTANATAAPFTLSTNVFSPATEVFPTRFPNGSLPLGYLVSGLPQANQLNFWYFPYYTTAAFNLALATEQPVTQGVLFTFGSLTTTADSFTGPIRVVTGDKDFIFCYSNCYAVPPGSGLASILDGVRKLYPKTDKFSTQIPANTGHGISGHTSAPATYSDIQEYLLGTTK